jgi:hypothetical protein
MQRREYLATGVTVTAGTLAGCSFGGSGGGDSTDDGNGDASDTPTGPAIGDVSLSGPASATVRDDINLTVSVTNSGTAEAEFSDTVRLADGTEASSDVSFAVPADETVEETVTLNVGIPSGDRTAELAGDGASTTVSVDPIRAEVGEEGPDVSSGINVDVNSARITSVLFEEGDVEISAFDERDRTTVYRSPEGQLFVDIEVQSIDADALTDGVLIRDTFDIEGVTFEGVEPPTTVGDLLRPGETDDVPGAVGVNNTFFGTVEAGTDIGPLTYTPQEYDTPTVVWELPPVPNTARPFEVASVDVPDTQPVDQPYTLAVEVRNTSDAAHTFEGVLQYDTDQYGWLDLEAASMTDPVVTVPAGETERIEVETESGVKGEFTYRLAPFDRTWSVTFE